MDPVEHLAGQAPTIDRALALKAFAKVGDAISNLIYSLAKTKVAITLHDSVDVKGTPKVSARILREALDGPRRRHPGVLAKVRGDEHALADAAEAIIAFGWVHGHVNIDEWAGKLSDVIIERQPAKTRDEIKAWAIGFEQLLEWVISKEKT